MSIEEEIAQALHQDDVVRGRVFVGFDEVDAETKAWYIDNALAVMPLVKRAQVEALDRAAGAIADLRPNGITVIADVNARRRDEALWEAQSTVQGMVRDVENELAGADEP